MTYSVLGFDEEGSQVQVSQASRREGMYLIGATGTGKSTLIENLVIEDVKNGLGVCVIDPHGDLTNAIISRLAYLSEHDPKERMRELFTQRLEEDVILIDLASREYVAPFNLFHCEDLNDVFEVENVVSAFMHILESVYQISPLTPQMSQYFTAIAHTLIYNPTYTLLDINLLLTDKAFRAKLVANIPDPHLKWFWNVFYEDHRKGYKRDDDISAVVNKLNEFIKPVMKPWFGTIQKTLNFRQLMDEKKLVFIKLNSQWGNLTKLIGNIVIAQLLDAAYSRSNIPVKKRRQMNIYVDEFQKFASEDFATLFTEARKFGLGLTISHQVISQVPEKIKETCEQATNIVVFKVSANNAEKLASVFDTTPPPGEPIREQVMERQYESETVITWEPPESEAEYHRELQRLTEKKENAILKAAILYTAVFGPIKYFNFFDHNENAKIVLKKLESITEFYSIETYNKTGSFVIPKTHTRVTEKYHSMEGNASAWTEKFYHEYTLDPLSNSLILAFNPTMSHKEALKRIGIPDTLAKFDTDLQEIDKKVRTYEKQVEAAFYAKWQEEKNMKGLQKIRYEMTTESIDHKIKNSGWAEESYIRREINKQVKPYEEKLIAEAKQKRRAALQGMRSHTGSIPTGPLPFTIFLGNLRKPIKEGEYDYSSLKNNPHIEASIQFPYNSNTDFPFNHSGTSKEIKETKKGLYLVPAPDDTRRKTIRAAREIYYAFDTATSKRRNKVRYIRYMSNKDLWINDLKQDSSIFWKWRYFEEGALWFLLACQELAKQIITFTKDLEDFTVNFPAQHMKTTVFKRDTGIDVPTKKFMGYRSTIYGYGGAAIPSEPQYEPMYTYKPGKPPYGSDEVARRTANQIKQFPKYTARVRLESGEYTITTLEPKGYIKDSNLKEWIAEIQERNVEQGYLRLRSEVEEEIRKRNQPPDDDGDGGDDPPPPPGGSGGGAVPKKPDNGGTPSANRPPTPPPTPRKRKIGS